MEMSNDASFQFPTQSRALLSSQRYRSAKQEIVNAILEGASCINGIRPGSSAPEVKEAYQRAIRDFQKDRGRELFYPFISSGIGNGPFVELLDGSVKYDLITGIGINFFGHTHPELVSEMVDALSSDTMQGNLQPGHEAKEALRAVLSRVGSGCRLAHGWLLCSGTMSNEIALKIIRQKKAPATKVLAFKDCFAGRSTTMQEITDNPGYRQGQPVYGEAYYLPFYDPKLGLEGSVNATISGMKEHLTRYPDKFCALMIELVQGEGGFNVAPREFYARIFEEAKKANLAVWVDEIQTFGRTGELFAFQKLGLSEYVDVVTIGKMLQACMVLYAPEFNPKPGLVAGTFAGSAVALRTSRKVLELLERENFLGKEGRIEKLSSSFRASLEKIAEQRGKTMLSDIRAFGAMIAFQPLAGTMDDVKSVLFKLFDKGVVAFYCGHGPFLIRLLPPLGAMSEQQIDEVCKILEEALVEAAQEKQPKERDQAGGTT